MKILVCVVRFRDPALSFEVRAILIALFFYPYPRKKRKRSDPKCNGSEVPLLSFSFQAWQRMTKTLILLFDLARVRSIHISPSFTLP